MWAHQEFEILCLWVQLAERLGADLFNRLRGRLVSRQQPSHNFHDEIRKGCVHLSDDRGIALGKSAEYAILKRLNLGAKFNELLTRERPGRVRTLLEAGDAGSGDLALAELPRRQPGNRGRCERSIEGDEFAERDGHGCRGVVSQATTAASAPSREIAPSSSSRRTTWMIASCAISTSFRRTAPSIEISSRRLSAARFEMDP